MNSFFRKYISASWKLFWVYFFFEASANFDPSFWQNLTFYYFGSCLIDYQLWRYNNCDIS